MSNSLIIIIIPSKTIRKNCKGMFPDFGENPEKTAVAITAQKISYLPLEKEKIEVLILSERKLPLEISSYVNDIVDGKEFIFIGRHQRTEEFDDNFLNATNFPNKKIAYLDFHRVDSNPFYQGLMDLCQLIGSSYSPISLDENIRRLRACFNVDWELEDILKRKHHLLLSGEAIDIPDNVLIVWNEDDFGAKLKQNAGEANVAVSKIEFEKKLKQKKQVLVLAELTWSSHKFSQFYGYEFARELIFTHDALNLSFISCLPRNELQSVNPAAQLMVPVFHHFLLPSQKMQSIYSNFLIFLKQSSL